MLSINFTPMISKVSGFVKNRGCTRRASGLGRCTHVVALLLLLSNFISEKGYTVQSPSTSCNLNKGKNV